MVKMGSHGWAVAVTGSAGAPEGVAATVAAEAETAVPAAGVVASLSFRLRPKRRRSPCGRARPEHRVVRG